AINGVWTYDDAGLVYLGKDNPLLASRIVDVTEAEDGSIWMVSRGNGVIVKTGNTYEHILGENGLVANMCRCVFMDSGNVVWVGTNNGLSRIAFTRDHGFNYTIASYSAQNGLLTNEVNAILRVGRKLWTVHTNGISVFDPADLNGNTNTPPVYITSTLVNGDTLRAGSNQFAYDQNYFNISFIGLSFQDPGRITYRYKMEGVDSDWITTPYTSVKYQTLPPGEYRFLVQASSNDGYWSPSPAVLSFVILPAWWQTWIFKSCAILFILVVLFVLFKWRVSHIRSRDHRKSILQNRIATFELNALRAQMNPHFVFNSINSVQYFITNNDPDSSQKYLSKFAKLIRYVVDNSKLASIPVKTEIEALTLYLELEALRFGERLEYAIHVHPELDQEYMQIPSMLIQPYVENAIWHGLMHKKGNGRIDVTLEIQSGVIHCIIEDNGIGRQKSLELKKQNQPDVHKSVGMSNTRDRLEIINQVNSSNMNVTITDLYDAHGEAGGTKVEIHIPVA
ncbi:MAG TPA: histidine kinase, partial [Bacteroidia bacterium]|nr:histidine kinase [Bacteroidia bacterium]